MMGCPTRASSYLFVFIRSQKERFYLYIFDMMKTIDENKRGAIDMEFHMKENGFSTTTTYGTLDISSEEAYGFRPYQLLVSSIAVCSGGVLRKIMEKRRQKVNDIHIKANVTRSGVGANEVQKIHLHFTVEAENVTEEQMEKNMRITRKNCSMIQSVKDSIDIIETFELRL